MTSESKQTIHLSEAPDTQANNQKDKKAARAELRALRDAFPLKTNEIEGVKDDSNTIDNDKHDSVNLKRVTAFCSAERINLKYLTAFLKEQKMFTKAVAYYGECLYANVNLQTTVAQRTRTHGSRQKVSDISKSLYESFDVFFFDYGVTVFWGTSPQMENKILKLIKVAEINAYPHSQIEVENFSYGLTDNQPLFCNDVIYLNNEYYFHKMIISCAIAQSVKLDYFEELTERTIESVKDLPEQVGNWGKTSYTRKGILRLVGKLHKLRIDLNLVTNILDEPELLWNFPKYSELYESFRRCLEIKTRADILNLRCDVIHGILGILSENINTRNSERLEKMMIGLIGTSVVVGIIQILVLLFKN